jgi:Ser/Thr protein kinase RdoA (MazF antagonist)
MRKYKHLVKEAQKRYNLNPVKSYRRTTRGFDNVNLILNTADNKQYLLRRFFWPETNLDHLKERLDLKILLREKYFLCRRILPDKDGKYFFYYNKRFNALYSYINARNPRINQIRKHAHKLSSLIGELHVYTKDFELKYNLIDWTQPSPDVLKTYNNIPQEYLWGMTKDEILEKLTHYTKKINALPLPRGLIHADVTENNILIDQLGNVYLIDFDNMHPDILIKDLCFPIESTFIDYKRWTPKLQEKIHQIIKAYDNKRKLLKIEKENLIDVIKHNLLQNAVWYVYEWQKGHKKQRRAMLLAKRRIQAYLFMEREMRNFLETFRLTP